MAWILIVVADGTLHSDLTVTLYMKHIQYLYWFTATEQAIFFRGQIPIISQLLSQACLVITSIIQCELKLIILSRTLMVQPLKFKNG